MSETGTPPGEWLIFRGAGEGHDGISRLPPPPPWRDFSDRQNGANRRLGVHRRSAAAWRPGAEALEVINAALYLRRPLLVTGAPGVGKSSLAYAVADELGLGSVLRWPIVSRSTLQDGLYQYDAIARLQDAQLAAHTPGEAAPGYPGSVESIGDYIRLGPLGTALMPSDSDRPRVLLIDELDKSDIDLPNNLLNVFEEGEFAIPELERIAHRLPDETAQVRTADGRLAPVRGGRVQCTTFPFVVLTSNQERDFPAALMRRCLHLELARPDHERLAAVVRAHLGPEREEAAAGLIQRFLDRSGTEMLAADQLLGAIHLTAQAPGTGREHLADLLIQRLDPPR